MEEKQITTAETNLTTQIAESGQGEEHLASQTESTVQSPEKNREFAQRRRNIEREELTQKIRLETVKSIVGEKNPFNDKPFSSQEDIDDYIKTLTANKNNTGKDWYYLDRQKFFELNTDFDEQKFQDLLDNPEFIEFSQGKVGVLPLTEIYNDFNLFNKKVEELAIEKAQIMYLKKFSSPGSLNSSATSKSNTWNDMTEQEFEREIERAKKGYYTSKGK